MARKKMRKMATLMPDSKAAEWTWMSPTRRAKGKRMMRNMTKRVNLCNIRGANNVTSRSKTKASRDDLSKLSQISKTKRPTLRG